MQDGYARSGTALDVDAAAARRLVQRLLATDAARAFGVRDSQGVALSAVVVAQDGRTAYYWIAGSRPGPGMTVLLAGLLPLLQREGFDTFDFVGANVPSIAEFKRRFGPQLTPYVFAQRDFHPALRWARRLAGRG